MAFYISGDIAVNLFLTMLFSLPQNDLRGGIDIVTRTATAVLGGYFLSQNFIKKGQNF